MRCAEKVAAAYALGKRDAIDAAREAAAKARAWQIVSNALCFKLGQAAGIKDGLGAARDAVAALDHAPRCELVWGCECSESHPLECTCNRDDALAAIDALREKQ